MTPSEARFVHLANLLVGGSGIVLAIALYALEPSNEFALHHAWVSPSLAIHVVTAPLLALAVAMIWRLHAWQRIRSGYRKRRLTGLLLAASFFPMVFSAPLLQVAESESTRQFWLVVHLASSSLWLAAFAAHLAWKHVRAHHPDGQDI